MTATERDRAAADAGEGPGHARRWWVLATMTVCLLVVIMGNTTLNVAIPTLQRELGASQGELQWAIDAYILVFAGLLFSWGVVGDRIGRRRVLLVGLSIYAVAAVFGAFSGSPIELIVWRAVMGIGGAAVQPATLAVITNVFPQGERGRAIGVWAGTAGLAAGVLVGGWAGVVAGGLVAAGADRLLRRGQDEDRRNGTALMADLPIGCDLLAVCLAAGLPVPTALGAVAAAVPGPLGAELVTVAGLHRLGAPPGRAWSGVPAELAVLGRVLVRGGESGSAVVAALHGLAADSRAEARSRADAAVRRAGVWVLAPLGACFLPAFLCLGVVPLVLGIAADVFG